MCSDELKSEAHHKPHWSIHPSGIPIRHTRAVSQPNLAQYTPLFTGSLLGSISFANCHSWCRVDDEVDGTRLANEDVRISKAEEAVQLPAHSSMQAPHCLLTCQRRAFEPHLHGTSSGGYIG
jgi:hypothetical protein